MKYKLKIKYPGCVVNVGFIIEKDEKDFYTFNTDFIVPFFIPKNIENYPEIWEKIEELLFITNDGVNIFDKTEYFLVTDFFRIDRHFSNKNKKYINYYKTFSTKKLAEIYVIENKPCLSLNDIKNHLGSSHNNWFTLKELIKTKII